MALTFQPGDFYAGIGARKTPTNIAFIMVGIGHRFAARGFRLRSGHAEGADISFEGGCGSFGGISEIFTPAQCRQAWLDHATLFHPAWDKCSNYAQRAHARNSAIMLGATLDYPVKFVVCWTANGRATGGTGQALRIADRYQIPVFNLHDETALVKLQQHTGMILT